MKNNVKW